LKIQNQLICKNCKKFKIFKQKINERYKRNFFVQFFWLLWRSVIAEVRDPFAFRISLIQTIFIALLVGLIFLQIKLDQAGVQNINGIY
jgi:hypothetical protein